MKKNLSIDMGVSTIKFYSEEGGVGEIPSFLAKGNLSNISGEGDGQTIIATYGGVDYVIGEGAQYCRSFSLKTDEVKSETKNLIFILAALATTGAPKDVSLMVGLPVGSFDR